MNFVNITMTIVIQLDWDMIKEIQVMPGEKEFCL